ncbi:MAG TPA: hypothetical protein PKC94_25320 [Leptospiraceae bacterium]|nr:hypothetical protein [Leptospiraceae bacterium]
MAQEDSSTVAVKSIRLGVILVAAFLLIGYFYWSNLTWDERLTLTWNVLSLVTLAAFVFGILASAIQYTLGQESPFIASLFKFPTEWLKYKAALFEAKRNDMLTQEQLLQQNAKSKQDIVDFIQISRDTLELIKSEIPVIVESKFQDHLREFESIAKETLAKYADNTRTTSEALTSKYQANRELMRNLCIQWLTESEVIDSIETPEQLAEAWNCDSLLKYVEEKSETLVKQGFNLSVIEQFVKKQNDWILKKILEGRK